MEFWGVEVLPKKELKWEFEDNCYIHVSNVAIGPTDKCSANERVVVRVKCNEMDVVLGTLTPKVCDQIPLDLIFGEDFTLSHSGSNCSVFFTGYRTDGPVCDSEDDDEEEDEEHVPFAVNGGNGFKPKVLAASEKKSSGNGSSDDESDDDSLDLESDDMHVADLNSSDLDDDSDDDDEDDDSDDSDDSDEKNAPVPEPQPVKSGNKKRAAGSPAVASPAEKKIKTPSKPVPVKAEKAEKSDKKPAQKPPTTPASVEKSEKKKKDKAPKTPDTKAKDEKAKLVSTPSTIVSPSSQAGSASKYYCHDCQRSFVNETGVAQHKLAKHGKK